MTKDRSRRARLGVLGCIAVAASLAATGCSSTTAPTAEIIYTAPPVTDVSAASVAPTIDSIVITTSAPDNQWSVTFKKPVISGGSNAAVKKMNDAIIAKVNGYIHDFNGHELPPVVAGNKPSTLEGNFSIAIVSPTVLSLRFSIVTSLAGADSLTIEPGSINFWVPTGATLALTDVVNDPKAALSAITKQAYNGLKADLGNVLTWNGKADSLAFFDAWDINKDGLEFLWARGKVAGLSAGSPAVTLPWANIKSIIRGDGPAGSLEK